MLTIKFKIALAPIIIIAGTFGRKPLGTTVPRIKKPSYLCPVGPQTTNVITSWSLNINASRSNQGTSSPAHPL